MIEIRKPNAFRLAFKVASRADDHLGYVAIYSDGSLGATDGISAVISADAHDCEVPLFVKPEGSIALSKTADLYQISDDLCTLIEHRPRSEATFDISVQRGLRFPPLHKLVPGHLTPEAGEAPPFDSILAGRLASDYGLDVGVWRRGPWRGRVYLEGTDDGDIVVLAGIIREEANE